MRLDFSAQICCSSAPALVHSSHPSSPKLVLWLGECPNSADLEYGPLPLSTATAGNLGVNQAQKWVYTTQSHYTSVRTRCHRGVRASLLLCFLQRLDSVLLACAVH